MPGGVLGIKELGLIRKGRLLVVIYLIWSRVGIAREAYGLVVDRMGLLKVTDLV